MARNKMSAKQRKYFGKKTRRVARAVATKTRRVYARARSRVRGAATRAKSASPWKLGALLPVLFIVGRGLFGRGAGQATGAVNILQGGFTVELTKGAVMRFLNSVSCDVIGINILPGTTAFGPIHQDTKFHAEGPMAVGTMFLAGWAASWVATKTGANRAFRRVTGGRVTI